MTHHVLQSRHESEVLWFQRRSVLHAAAAWMATGGFAAAQAQERSNIVLLTGDATLNGARLRDGQSIQTGDQIATGPRSSVLFVVGNASFQVRQNSQMAVERGATLNAVSLLRLLSGAVVSVFGRGPQRQIVTPTMTAGIRGTGVYTEVFPERASRTYFCNCYGTVDVAAGPDRTISQADYHQSFWAEAEAVNGRMLNPAKAINHTDDELEFLARLLDQRTAWQIQGKKGTKDGMGYLDSASNQPHPATMIAK